MTACWFRAGQEDLVRAVLEERDVLAVMPTGSGKAPGFQLIGTLSGPEGDNGLGGKKLVAQAYGTAVPIGGGATFGKDPRKVDPRGQATARQIALDLVRSGQAREATVWLVWRSGDVEPHWKQVVTEPRQQTEHLGVRIRSITPGLLCGMSDFVDQPCKCLERAGAIHGSGAKAFVDPGSGHCHYEGAVGPHRHTRAITPGVERASILLFPKVSATGSSHQLPPRLSGLG